MSKLDEWISGSPERAREFAQERLIAEVAEEIWASMERARLSKTDVADRLGKTKAFVGQVLNGTRNMTLRTLADIAHVLDRKVQISLHEKAAITGWEPVKGGFTAQFRPTLVADGLLEVSNGDEWHSLRVHEERSTEAA